MRKKITKRESEIEKAKVRERDRERGKLFRGDG